MIKSPVKILHLLAPFNLMQKEVVAKINKGSENRLMAISLHQVSE